jgi:hypothetical protein
MTTAEIKAKHRKRHDTLSRKFYTKKHSAGVTPQEQEEFDLAHAKVWADMEAEIKKASDYVAPVPPRDLEAEFDRLLEWAKGQGYG